MADNKAQLVKQWIQYLKNNQIVGLKSDPQTGRLDYKRAITPDDISNFLETKTDYSQDEISNAIHMVLSRQAVNKAAPKLTNDPQAPDGATQAAGQPPALPAPNVPQQQQQAPGKKYNNDDAEDIAYRDVPNKQLPAPAGQEEEQPPQRRKASPGSTRVRGNRTIHEDINDSQPHALDEKDVESIFSMLTSRQPAAADNTAAPTEKQRGQKNPPTPGANPAAQPAQQDPAKKEEDVRKLKRVIRDTMTPNQRMALWRALNE